ncbi:MAG TPA: hypothetical protein VFA40_24290 [Terriglobales bacterium]|nr:hypothetical protein [Terriglobales bacterium]
MDELIVTPPVQNDEVRTRSHLPPYDNAKMERVEKIKCRSDERQIPGTNVFVIPKISSFRPVAISEQAQTHSSSKSRKDGGIVPERYLRDFPAARGKSIAQSAYLRALAGAVDARERN